MTKLCYLWLELLESEIGGAITHMKGFLSGWKDIGNEFFIVSSKNFDYLKDYDKIYSIQIWYIKDM